MTKSDHEQLVNQTAPDDTQHHDKKPYTPPRFEAYGPIRNTTFGSPGGIGDSIDPVNFLGG